MHEKGMRLHESQLLIPWILLSFSTHTPLISPPFNATVTSHD